MRSILAFVVVLATIWIGTGGRAFADKIKPGFSNEQPGGHQVAFERRLGLKVNKLRKGERLAPAEVPELNPNAAGLALVLLAGGALLAVDRRRVLRA